MIWSCDIITNCFRRVAAKEHRARVADLRSHGIGIGDGKFQMLRRQPVDQRDGVFEILDHEFSGRDLILIVGGGFLIAKATWEIHGRMEGDDHQRDGGAVTSFWSVIAQIMVLDIIFSLDSVITAVGMVDEVAIMIAAVVIAVVVMLVASGYITRAIDRHPTLKMLALAFLMFRPQGLFGDKIIERV